MVPLIFCLITCYNYDIFALYFSRQKMKFVYKVKLIRFIILINSEEAKMYSYNVIASMYESIEATCLCLHTPGRVCLTAVTHSGFRVSFPCLKIFIVTEFEKALWSVSYPWQRGDCVHFVWDADEWSGIKKQQIKNQTWNKTKNRVKQN
jgi:hypothetical protein